MRPFRVPFPSCYYRLLWIWEDWCGKRLRALRQSVTHVDLISTLASLGIWDEVSGTTKGAQEQRPPKGQESPPDSAILRLYPRNSGPTDL